MASKYVYFFGSGKTEGQAKDKLLLGGKGANLAEMTNLGVPVPPGFTISTEVCSYYNSHSHQYPDSLKSELDEHVARLEKATGKGFGDAKNPLLVSVRSGAPVSMPGMMDTVLNLGLCDATLPGLIENTGNPRFAYDSYRRFIQMFSNVVLGMKHEDFETHLHAAKEAKGVEADTELDADDLKALIGKYLEAVKNRTGKAFPQDPRAQLQAAIDAVFNSWDNPRAVEYRRLYDIPSNYGTAVNVQSMVFGNMGNDSGTGVCFTRNPSNGEKTFYGEFLMNAQGEDVVAGIRTPLSVEKLAAENQAIYDQLLSVAHNLEDHFKDMQDIEFTIEKGRLYILQTRSGKRTAFAAIRVAVDLVAEGRIDEKTALLRIDPNTLPSLLARIFNEDEKKKAQAAGHVIAHGLPAGPGAASGRIAFTADKTVEMKKNGIPSVLVRTETSPEDITGMYTSEGILTSRGGMTSHAAVVARGMNKPCIVGCPTLKVDEEAGTATFRIGDQTVVLREGDHISIDGFTGEVYKSEIHTINSEIEQVFIEGSRSAESSRLARDFGTIMTWADRFARLQVRTNADTPHDADVARRYGATGIGLCRTEHMFFQEERILAMRQMILASNATDRKKALEKILPYQREDFKAIFRVMAGLPVTIRLLDPPLHEFLPHDEETILEIAASLGLSQEETESKIENLKEVNPMLGHRGCRLGISYPEITEMQTRAILEAAVELASEGIAVLPEIMIPLVGHALELEHQKRIVTETAGLVFTEKNRKVDYLLGTMIEVPRAAVTADKIAGIAEFFSFGTNDLTQLGNGFSRDDSEKFLPAYLELKIYEKNPFAVLDQEGVGELIRIAAQKGRSVNPGIKLGVCGEHGGDPSSIAFCESVGLDYVSCSPYRVSIARLAAAQAALRSAS